MAQDRSHRTNATAMIAIAACSAATAGVSLVTVNRLKDGVIDAVLHTRPLSFFTLLATLGPVDAVLALLSAATVLVLVWLEARRRVVSRFLATASGPESFIVLTILLAWFGHSYLNPGVLLGGDTGTHISRFLEVARGLDVGRLSDWTNYQYAGAPLLWFTGPLTYVAGGALAFLLHDAVLAAKLLLFSLHMLSGWLFFALLRRLDIRPVPAMLAAAAFAGSFAHLHLFLYRGVIPQALTIVFLVLLFYAADGLMRHRGRRWANWLIFALSTGAIIVNHQPHALFAGAYLAVFGGMALLAGFWRRQGVPLLFSAGLLGTVAATVAVVPVLVEADWVMIEPHDSLFRFHLPTLGRLLNLVVWRNSRTTWGIDYWAYLGIGMVALGGVGIFALVRGRLPIEHRAVALSSVACLFICLVMYNPVVRDVMFILFFVGLLSAMALDWLIARPFMGQRRLLLLAAIVVVDLASTSVQPVARTDKSFLVEAGLRLEQIAPYKRFVQLDVTRKGEYDADKGPDGGPISYYSTVQRVAGNHNMAATRVYNFLVAMVDMVESDVRSTGRLAPITLALLRIFNIGEIICTSPVANGCPVDIGNTVDDPVLGRYIPIDATPALFSQHLLPLDLGAALQKPMFWPEDLAVTSEHRARVDAVEAALGTYVAVERPQGVSAVAIAVIGDLPAAPSPNSVTWHPRIEAYQVSLDRVRLQVSTDGIGYVQVAHPWFPSTVVTINGAIVNPLRGTTNLVVLPLQPGTSTIELRDGMTMVRTLSEVASLFGLVGIGAFAAGLALNDCRVGKLRNPELLGCVEG